MGWPADRDWTISIDLAELFAAPAGPAIKPTNIAAAAAMARQAPRVLGTRSSGKVSDGLIGTAVLRCGRERKNIPEITIMLQRAAANTPERERRPLSLQVLEGLLSHQGNGGSRRAAMVPRKSRVQLLPSTTAQCIDENALRRWPATTRRSARRMSDRRIRRAPEACEQHDRPGGPCENSEMVETGETRRDPPPGAENSQDSPPGGGESKRPHQPPSPRLGAVGRGSARRSPSRAAAWVVRSREGRAAERRLMARNLRQGWRVRRQNLPRRVHEHDAILKALS